MTDPRNEIHALSGAYAVDALDPAERELFEAHLAVCSACQAEVASLREATALLSQADAEPPEELRGRVLSEITRIRPLPPEVTRETGPAATPAATPAVRRLPLRRRMAALAAAAAVLGIAGAGVVTWQQTHDQQQVLSVKDRVLQAADARRVTVALPGTASASVVRSVSEGRAVLITRNLPDAPADRVYELWLQTPAGVMVPAGLMTKAGSTTFVLEGDATRATAAGITVEPEGGSERPTTTPIALFDLTKAT